MNLSRGNTHRCHSPFLAPTVEPIAKRWAPQWANHIGWSPTNPSEASYGARVTCTTARRATCYPAMTAIPQWSSSLCDALHNGLTTSVGLRPIPACMTMLRCPTVEPTASRRSPQWVNHTTWSPTNPSGASYGARVAYTTARRETCYTAMTATPQWSPSLRDALHNGLTTSIGLRPIPACGPMP